MVFQEPKMEFVSVDLDTDVSCASNCETSAMRAGGVETCDCTDGFKDGAVGASEPDCDNSGGAIVEW